MNTKIAVIGAASAVFGLKTLRDIALSHQLEDSEVVLVDVDAENLEVMYRLGLRLIKEHGSRVRLSRTADRVAAISGAEFVIISVSRNKNTLWLLDFSVPMKHGIRHTLGENGGLGGLFHSLRSIHLIMPIVEDVERICPKALILNYSNPLSRVGMAIAKTSNARAIGFCHELQHRLNQLSEMLGVPTEDMEVTSAGLNHFAFILKLVQRSSGEDLYPRLRAAGDIGRAHRFCRVLMESLGYLPATGDLHIGEYFAYATEFCEPRDIRRFLGGDRWRESLMGRYDRIARGEEPLEDSMKRLSGERAVYVVIAAKSDGRTREIALNVPNDGVIDNLPSDAIVEVPATVGAGGAEGERMGRLPEGIASRLRQQVDVQRLVVEAAIRGDRKLAWEAAVIDPAIPSLKAARQAFEELCEREKEFLPFC